MRWLVQGELKMLHAHKLRIGIKHHRINHKRASFKQDAEPI
jgi:hypothetical protein